MMKKRVIVNYSSTFGLPGVRPDAGMALIHLLESKTIDLEAIVISGDALRLPGISASIYWLLKFSGRSDVRVFGHPDSNEAAADSLLTFLNERKKANGPRAILLDIGAPAVLGIAAGKINSLTDYFSEIVIWNPRTIPPQRRDVSYPKSSFQDELLKSIFTQSGCTLTCFQEEAAYQSPLDFDELVGIRTASKPLYYLLKDYLILRASKQQTTQDFLYRLPPAVYLTNPELFSICEDRKDGVALNICTHISDITAYNKILKKTWSSWHKQVTE